MELSRRRREAVRQGNDGDSAAAGSAASLNALAAQFEPGLPLTDREIDGLFESLAGAIEAAHEPSWRHTQPCPR